LTAVRRIIGTSLATVLVLALSSCDQGDQAKPKAVPTVGFVVVKPGPVPIEVSLGGRTVAFESSDVRPQVNGVIRARLFTEGAMVHQGQPLFQIDPSLYRASANQAQANLQSAEATAEAAAAKAERYRPLAAMEAVSKQDYTDALGVAKQSRAAVAQYRAALETARINLRFTTVPAPITGRIGRSLFTTGALVQASQADPLASIQRLDPIYVDIQQSSADLLSLRKALSSGGVAPGSTAVRLKLEDGSDYGPVGTVQFSEMTVNESTGTVTLRARFPNPEGMLLPGMFVQARFDQAVNPSAYLVPQVALERDVNGEAMVYVVVGDKVERRKITADRTMGTNWVVTAGLQPGDKIVTQGLGTTLKSGAKVKAVPASAPMRVGPPKGGKQGAGAAGAGSAGAKG